MPKSKKTQASQYDTFVKAARETGCDEDPARFDAALKKVARHKPKAEQPPPANEPKTKKPG